MFLKTLLNKHKMKVGRLKVYKRYRKIMRNFPPSVVLEEGESFENYSDRVDKRLQLLSRCNRLNRIFLKELEKED